MATDAPNVVTLYAITDALHPPEPAHPIAWIEHETEWVIVYEDGRKIRHPKPAEIPPAADPNQLQDIANTRSKHGKARRTPKVP